MQSSVMAFFPNIGTAKLELHSLYRKYIDMFGASSNNSKVGGLTTSKMQHLPVLLIDSNLFNTVTAIRSIAVSYGALMLRWLLSKTSVVQRTIISRAMRSRSSWCGSLPFLVGTGVLMARLYNYIMINNHIYGRQFILGHNANLHGETAMGMENSELCNEQPFLPSLLVHKRGYARLVLQCLCYPASLKVVGIKQKNLSFNWKSIRSSHEIRPLLRLMAGNERYLAFMMVLVALHLFLQLARVNVTTLFLPILSRTSSSRSSAAVIANIVLVLVNSCGILGSSLATKQYGREVTFTIGAILMVICEVATPLILEVQIGVGGGARMPTGYMMSMFALTCVVTCGLSWSWGSLFWTMPYNMAHSAGQVMAVVLNLGVCFVQMQYFLLMLCRLKNAILAYYAMWIWS